MSNPNNSTELGGRNEKFDVRVKEYEFDIGSTDFDIDFNSEKTIATKYDPANIEFMKIIAKVGHADIEKVKNAKKKAVEARLQSKQKDEAR